MIIDAHGHYTTAPAELQAYRGAQVGFLAQPTKGRVNITDDQIRQSIENGPLRIQRERGVDLTLFSAPARGMGHHFGGPLVSRYWSETCNDLVYRVTELFPDSFAGVCQLPQSPGVSPASCVDELERCVTKLGFVGANLNPDPSGGYWTDPPLTDRYWYPLYEKLVELDVPAMIHVSASCNPNFHDTASHYINGDTTAFVQCLYQPQLFKDFPTLRFVIPHGGGAVPYHWGRYRGMALSTAQMELDDLLLNNISFDTCVYHQPGIDLLLKVIRAENVLFASEILGAVPGNDPRTGRGFDDTKSYVDNVPLSAADKALIFEGNARRVYPRLNKRLESA